MVSWAPDEGYEHAGLTRGWFGSGGGLRPRESPHSPLLIELLTQPKALRDTRHVTSDDQLQFQSVRRNAARSSQARIWIFRDILKKANMGVVSV